MRYAITPEQVKKLAIRLGRAAPALPHTTCLAAVARIAGYRDWHDVINQGPVPDDGPTLPREGSLHFSDAREFLKRAQQVLEPLKGCCPVFSTESPDIQLGEFLGYAGLAGGPDVECAYRAHPLASELPRQGSAFYQLGLTDAYDRPDAHPEAEWSFHVPGPKLRRQELMFGGGLPEDVEHWLETKCTASVEEKERFRRIARSGNTPPTGLSQTTDGANVLIRERRWLALARDSKSQIKAAAICDIQVTVFQASNKAVLRVRVYEGLFEPSKSRLAHIVGQAMYCFVQEVLATLIWSMLGADSARLEVHIDAETSGNRTRNAEVSKDTYGYVADLTFDDRYTHGLWQKDDKADGMHFYRGQLPPA